MRQGQVALTRIVSLRSNTSRTHCCARLNLNDVSEHVSLSACDFAGESLLAEMNLGVGSKQIRLKKRSQPDHFFPIEDSYYHPHKIMSRSFSYSLHLTAASFEVASTFSNNSLTCVWVTANTCTHRVRVSTCWGNFDANQKTVRCMPATNVDEFCIIYVKSN